MDLPNILALIVMTFFTRSDNYEEPSITLSTPDHFTTIYSTVQMVCRLVGPYDNEKVSFYKGINTEVASAFYNKHHTCWSTIRDPYYTSCLSRDGERTRRFELVIDKIPEDLILSKWSCQHKYRGRSNFVWLTPFNMSLTPHIYEPDNWHIPLKSPIDLICIIHPAQSIDGTISFKLYPTKNREIIIATVIQDFNNCSGTSKNAICGEGTKSFFSKLKKYKFQIKEMKIDYYNIWVCSQSVFEIKSNLLDLKPYRKCEIRCTHGLVDTVKCKCKCSEFWDGPYCENCIITCEHGKRLDDCTCECAFEWSGPNCDVETPCPDRRCVNGDKNQMNCTCNCRKYWTGVLCDICVRECGPGTADTKTCICKCPAPWFGEKCEHCKTSCGHGIIDQQTCTCICDTHWAGPHCDACVKTCVNGEINAIICNCICFDKWTGDSCDMPTGTSERQISGIDPVYFALIAAIALLVLSFPMGIYMYRKKNKITRRKRDERTDQTETDYASTYYQGPNFYYT